MMNQTTLTGKNIVKAKPFLKWAGGKGQLLSTLDKYWPKNYNTYFEPFLGGGAVFFHLEPEKAVINDLNKELINVYETIRDNCEILMEKLDGLQRFVSDKEYFYKIRAKNPNRMKKINRAARTIFLNKTCFNGMYRVNSKGKFNVPFGDMKKPQLYVYDNLLECKKRLTKTTILAKDYKQLLRRIKKNDFVYLDPPYIPMSDTAHFTSYTKEGFGNKEQKELSEFCIKLDKKGAKFLLNNSYNDKTIELFEKRFNRKFVTATVTMKIEAKRNVAAKSSSRKPVYECVITNY